MDRLEKNARLAVAKYFLNYFSSVALRLDTDNEPTTEELARAEKLQAYADGIYFALGASPKRGNWPAMAAIKLHEEHGFDLINATPERIAELALEHITVWDEFDRRLPDY